MFRACLLRPVLSLLPALLAAAALACPYSIRDAGFIVRDPLPYQVAVVLREASPAVASAWRGEVERAAAASFDHANVKAVVVDLAREPDAVVAEALLQAQWEVRAASAVLVSPAGEVLMLQSPLAEPAQAELPRLLRRAVESPVRAQLAESLIPAWCVMVVMTGADPAENEAVLKQVSAAARKLVGFRPEMGDPVKRAAPVVSLAWDDPEEEVLRWALHFSGRAAQVALVFGQGRRVGPVVSAAQATEGRLLELCKLLGKNCTCTADPSWFLGPALPLNWGRERQQQVREGLGFDPNSPAVATTLSGVWKTLRQPGETPVAGETVPDPTTGYVEFNVEQDAKPPADPQPQEQPEGGDDLGLEQRSWRAAYLIGGALTAAAGAGTAWLLIRARRAG